MHPVLLRVAVVMSAAVVCCGCDNGSSGPPTAHVSGAVTLHGEPLPPDASARLIFKPTQSGQARSTQAMIENSRYDSPETPQGNVLVLFSINQPKGAPPKPGGHGAIQEYENLVPEEFGSGVEVQIEADTDELDFEL